MRIPSPSWRDRGHRRGSGADEPLPRHCQQRDDPRPEQPAWGAGEHAAFGTGSVAVLYHLLQATCEAGDEAVYAWRSFEAYPIAVPLTGATSVPVPLGPGAVHDLEAMRRAALRHEGDHALHPNNPTGPALQHQPVIDFIDSLPDHIMIILDEAYGVRH